MRSSKSRWQQNRDFPRPGLSQVFAVRTATVSWLANSCDSPMILGINPEFTAKVHKPAQFETTTFSWPKSLLFLANFVMS